MEEGMIEGGEKVSRGRRTAGSFKFCGGGGPG